ncbi:RDD family protein [Streptomyces sp. NPDC051320]|uniref:RDD family protein n=1 Tax=Streptomyces sp. NPDC051320 TaxID=3154644 RepID=UPI003421CB78
MSTDPPPSGPPPEDDPFLKKPQDDVPPPPGNPYDNPPHGSTPPGGGPYGGGGPQQPPPPPGGGSDGPYGAPPPPYDPNAYGGGYGGSDPLAGMPPLAPSGKRVLARIVDIVIVAVVVWLISLAFGGFRYNYTSDNVAYGREVGQSILAAILYVGYDTFMTSRGSGQTYGKRLLNLRTANLNDGTTPTVQSAFVRALVLWLPAVFCCACVWTAICGGWSFFDRPYKQGLHDKAAKTVVVSAPQ